MICIVYYIILYYIISIKICLSSIAVACCKWDPAGSGLRRDLATLPSDMWIWALWAGHCRPKSILWIQNSKCGSTYCTYFFSWCLCSIFLPCLELMRRRWSSGTAERCFELSTQAVTQCLQPVKRSEQDMSYAGAAALSCNSVLTHSIHTQ